MRRVRRRAEHQAHTLIARIERPDDASTDWCYYEHWLGALEDVLASRGAVRHHDVTARATELGQRPAGHDHEQ